MGVQFDEDNFTRKQYRSYAPIPGVEGDTRGMAGWLIRNGLAKSALSANIILMIVLSLVFMFSVHVFRNGLVLPGNKEVPVQPAPFPVLENR
jgi:hypothetical protein